MKITNTSALSNVTRTLDIPMTEEQYDRYMKGVEHVQNIFPELSTDDREFLITGITPEEWEEAFK